MNKIILIFIVLTLVFTNTYAKSRKAHVTKEKKGQKYYLNRCSSCHGAGNRGGNINSIIEWENTFKNNAKDMIELHEGEEGTQNILLYLKSKDMKNERKRMVKFLQEFAYDSEVIPTCN